MKISLIQPGVYHTLGPFYPAALIHVASDLMRRGHEVRVHDDQLERITADEVRDADVVGLTCMGGREVNRGLEIVEELRAGGINVPFLWGGTQTTMTPDLALQDDRVDAVFRGYAEESIGDAIDDIAKGKDRPSTSNEAPCWTPMNPDWYPLPYHLATPNRYSEHIGFPMQASRGCKGRCDFCYLNQWGHPPITFLPKETVLGEMQHLHEQFGVNQIWFVDDNFFWNRDRVVSICQEMIRRKMGMRWIGSARVDDFATFGDADLDLIHQSGCVQINFGGESGSDEELTRMNKHITSDQLISAARRSVEHKIQCHFNFVLGYPGTTSNELRDTVRVLREMDRPELQEYVSSWFRFSVFTPWPGTKGFRTGVEAGFRPPQTFLEWGDYAYYDIERVNTVDPDLKKEIKSVFYLDYFLRHFPEAHRNLSNNPVLSDWMNALEAFHAPNRERMKKQWNEMNFEDSRLFDQFEAEILIPIGRENNYIFPI